jgi:hypothetical protein
VLDSSNARTEAHAQHGEGGQVDLGIAVGVGVMLFELSMRRFLCDVSKPRYRKKAP